MKAFDGKENHLMGGFIPLCGVLTAGLGSTALFGWIAGLPLLARFGADIIPMAPSTALFFLLYGTLLCFQARTSKNRQRCRAVVLIGTFASLVALLLFFLSLIGIHPAAEHLGLPITGSVNGAPIGHMSPLTAFCFVLAGVCFPTSLASRGRLSALALAVAALVISTGVVLLLAYVFGAPLLYGSSLIPPALSTSLGFLILGSGLLMFSAKEIRLRDRGLVIKLKRAKSVLTIIFILSTTGIMSVGYFYFRHYEEQFRIEMERELSTIADLKVGEIDHWRKERLGDAAVFFNNDIFSELVRRLLENRADPAARSRLQTWLAKTQQAYNYDRIYLLDAQGVELVSAPDEAETGTLHPGSGTFEVLQTGRISFMDFYREAPDRPIHLAVMVPIFDATDPKRAWGSLLVFRIDPQKYLYPLIQRWPVPSKTAETLLVRREGNEVVFLNDLRFQDDAALNLRFPLDQYRLPAASAARGEEGIFQGIDYRGEQVLSALRAVPDSPWFMVARMDVAEVYAPLRKRLWWMAGLVVLLVFSSAGAVFLVWQRKENQHYQALAQMQAALQKSEEYYRTTLMGIGDAVITTDVDGRVDLMNPVAEQLTGWMQSEAGGQKLEDVFHIINEKTGAAVENPVQRVLREGTVVGLANHTLLISRTGEQTPIADSGAPIRDTAQAIMGVVLVFRDQTREREAQQALRTEKEKFQLLVEESPLGVSIIAKDGAYKYINPRFIQLFGYTLEEVATGRDWFRKAFPEADQRMKAISAWVSYHAASGPDKRDPQTFEVACKDGSKKIINFFCVRTEAEEHFVLYEDLTAQKKIEAQLFQSQKMEAVGRLAGGVAHDFNNLMSVVIGFSEIILEKLGRDDPLREKLDEIYKAGRRATVLTRQLLAFSRKQIMQPNVLNLNHVVIDFEKMLRRLIGEDIELRTTLEPNLGRVKADPGQIEQVIMNLAVNARDAMPRGGKLTIETHNVFLDETYAYQHGVELEPGSYVMVAVSDTGIGMDKEIIAKIFEPFFTTKEKGQGTGLGLATVYGIVKQSGGYIWVYSEPGQGASFKIYLPRIEEDAEPLRRKQAAEKVASGSETILIVEDDDSVRKMTRTVLRSYGYTVLDTPSGEEALALSRQYAGVIHLLLTDVVMPTTSGRQLAKRVTRERPKLKVLYMSGYTDNIIAHHGILEHNVNFIQKPFTPKSLARVVREVLELGIVD